MKLLLKSTAIYLSVLLIFIFGYLILSDKKPANLKDSEQGVNKVNMMVDDHDHEGDITDKDYFEQIKVSPSIIEKAGYVYEIKNARYEYDPEYLKVMFKADIVLKNESFEPFIATGGNCDLVHDGKVVREGAGMQMSEITNVYPGESLNWQMFTSYTDGRRISRCIYSPTGAYDPNISIEWEVVE